MTTEEKIKEQVNSVWDMTMDCNVAVTNIQAILSSEIRKAQIKILEGLKYKDNKEPSVDIFFNGVYYQMAQHNAMIDKLISELIERGNSKKEDPCCDYCGLQSCNGICKIEEGREKV